MGGLCSPHSFRHVVATAMHQLSTSFCSELWDTLGVPYIADYFSPYVVHYVGGRFWILDFKGPKNVTSGRECDDVIQVTFAL